MQKLSSSGDLTRRLRRRINRHLQLPWLRITQEVTAALASPPYGKWIFPVFHRSGVPVWLCRDGYRSSLWLCVSYNGSPVLVHRLRGDKIHFHQAIKDRRTLIIRDIHYFDAHRLQPQLLQAPALQIHLRASHLVGPEGTGEAVEDPSSDEERSTTDVESEVEAAAEDADHPPEEPWCPPIPDAPDDPTVMEIAGAADKLETMINVLNLRQHLLPTEQPWCSTIPVASSQTYHFFDVHTRQVCPPFYVYRS